MKTPPKRKNRKPEILDIRVIGDALLRLKAEEVTTFDDELRDFIDDLVHTMYERDGAGLAAPQVGRSVRIFAIDPHFYSTNEKNPLVFINPRIVFSDGVFVYEEGCLSLPGIYEKVKRSRQIRMQALDPDGKPFEVEAEEYDAVVLQHEYDHLDGVLFTDRVATLRLLPWKKRIRELESLTDENGVNLLVVEES